jgi:O-antigen ligase
MAFITLLLYIVTIYLRPQEWVYAIYGWPVIDILAITTAFFLVWEIAQTKKLRILEPPNMLLLAFLGCVVLSHVARTYAWGAWDSFLKFGRNVVMFFLFVNTLNSPRKIKIVIWLIILLSVVLAIQGIYQYTHGFGWAGQPLILDRDMLRTTWVGIFNDPNDLALAFVVAIGFLLAFIFGKTNIFAKIISVPLVVVLLYSLYFTNSRGGYVALAATTAYFFLRKFKNKFLAVIVGGLLAFAIVIVGPSRMSDISAQEESAHGRIEAWYQGFQMLKTSPLFGVGYDMFKDYHERTAHNSYVLVAAEEGLIGLFFWIALIYMCFKGLYLLSQYPIPNTQYPIPYLRGLESALFGFLCASYFLSRSYIALFYIILALAAAFAYTMLKEEDYKFNVKDAGNVGMLTAGILVIVWFSMRISLRIFG